MCYNEKKQAAGVLKVHPIGQEVLHVGLQSFALAPCPLGEGVVLAEDDHEGPFGAVTHRMLGGGFADACAEFIVDPQEDFTIHRIQGQTHDIRNVPYHPVTEKIAIHLAAAVRDALPLQKIHQGQGAVIVPIQDSCLLPAILCHLQQIAVLIFPLTQRDLPYCFSITPVSGHVLGAAVGILLDEPIRHRDDLGCGAVIALHQ